MDSIFLLNEEERANFLQQIIHSFGCTYICLWSYLPHPSNCLLLLDGVYNEEKSQTVNSSSSYGSLFDQYKQSINAVVDKNSQVPGLAFKNRLPYIHLNTIDLQRLVSTQPQLQFYQETRIKDVIFMGCKSGEIEIGVSTDNQVMNLEREMRNLFPEDFSRQYLPRNFSHPSDQNQASSSSSSSLRSLNNAFIQKTLVDQPPLQQAFRPKLTQPKTSISTTTANNNNPFQQDLTPILNPKFPTLESVDAIMTKAMLAVITSSSSSSSFSPSLSDKHQKNIGAFKSYKSSALLSPTSRMDANNMRNQKMFKKSIMFFSKLNVERKNQEQMQVNNRPRSTLLHHVISERRRREKLNEKFQALTSLLPPDYCKKSKSSVLSSATKHLASLKAQVEDLSRINHTLEAHLTKIGAIDQEISSGSSNQRLEVRIIKSEEESTSEACVVDLKVNIRGEYSSMLNLVIRVLEFVKQVKSLSLLSVQAEAKMAEASSVNRVILRLKIEGGEWDESAFQEAVRRIVDDMAH